MTAGSSEEGRTRSVAVMRMDLAGYGSNPDMACRIRAVVERMGDLGEKEPPGRRPLRRRLGTVLQTVVAVLEESGTTRMYEIHKAVEERLGEPIPRSSIKNALVNHTMTGRRLFVRVGHGRYRSASH